MPIAFRQRNRLFKRAKASYILRLTLRQGKNRQMIGKAALDRLRGVEAGMISDCMMRLGLSGWMDGVRPVQPGMRRAVGTARTLLFGPRRGEGQWTQSMYRTIASLSPGDVLVFATGGTVENLMGDNIAT